MFAADGATHERRALFLAVKEVFQNVVLGIRDPAHAGAVMHVLEA